MEVIFVDTNILIEYLKGDRKLLNQIRFNNICISDVVLMELYQGARNKNDLNYIKKSLENISVVATDNDIISLAKNILEAYNLSHNSKIYDCIIAATVLIYDLPLLTYNKKDFQYIPDLKLY